MRGESGEKEGCRGVGRKGERKLWSACIVGEKNTFLKSGICILGCVEFCVYMCVDIYSYIDMICIDHMYLKTYVQMHCYGFISKENY